MRKHEFVAEYEQGDNSEQIFKELKAAGYEYLGGGLDATVWGRDEGEVLKVLMPSENKERAERSFMIFHDACIAMKNNPHVPRFVDEHSVFEINGTEYMQITMERLRPLAEGSFEEAMVWLLSDVASDDYYEDWESLVDLITEPDSWNGGATDIMDRMPELTWDRIQHDSNFRETYEGLFSTMRSLYIVAESNDLGWDLHTENVMQRADGTIVITDPFFTG